MGHVPYLSAHHQYCLKNVLHCTSYLLNNPSCSESQDKRGWKWRVTNQVNTLHPLAYTLGVDKTGRGRCYAQKWSRSLPQVNGRLYWPGHKGKWAAYQILPDSLCIKPVKRPCFQIAKKVNLTYQGMEALPRLQVWQLRPCLFPFLFKEKGLKKPQIGLKLVGKSVDFHCRKAVVAGWMATAQCLIKKTCHFDQSGLSFSQWGLVLLV